VAIVVGITFFSNSGSTIPISFSRFEKMLLSSDIEKLVLIKNKEIVEVTLKGEAVNNAKYSKELENRGPMSLPGGPHYRLLVASSEAFVEQFSKINEQLPEENRIDYQIEERSDFTSMFFNFGFIILMIFLFWMLMRRI